jgi:NADPH oxidase 2
MVNEGSRRLFIAVFVTVHAMVFVFGFINYDLKDNLTGARGAFGITYPIARAAALVLHFDVALILFRKLKYTGKVGMANCHSGVPDTHLPR